MVGGADLPRSLTLREDPIVLRDWRVGDAPALAPVCGEESVSRFTSVPWTYSSAAARAWMQWTAARRADGTGVVLAVTRAGEEDRALGAVNLGRFEAGGGELGYWLVPAARAQGLATGAARLLCAGGFAELGLERIELAVRPDNHASQRVAERLGAERLGLRPDSHQADGRMWDMVVYRLRASARR